MIAPPSQPAHGEASLDERQIYLAFGATVARRRHDLRLTQAQVATRIGMSRAAVANIELGRQNVLLHHVYLLAKALELKDAIELLTAAKKENLVNLSRAIVVSGESPLTRQQKSQIEGVVAGVRTTSVKRKKS